MDQKNTPDKGNDEKKWELYPGLLQSAGKRKHGLAGEGPAPAEERKPALAEEQDVPVKAPDYKESFVPEPDPARGEKQRESGKTKSFLSHAKQMTKKGVHSFIDSVRRIEELEYEEDESVPKPGPAVPPTPVKTPEELLEDELDGKYKTFSALLPMTEEALGPEDESGEGPFAGALLKKWRYSLKVGECPAMLARLEEICAPSGEAQPREALARWMAFLKDAGIRQMHGGLTELTVSMAERPYYGNGNEFMDGTLCRIEQHPWLCREKLICPGMLSPAAETKDAPPREAEAPAAKQTDGGNEDV